jgi:hypothetical protein
MRYDWPFNATWNELFAQFAPILIDEGTTKQILQRLTEFARDREWDEFAPVIERDNEEFVSYAVEESAAEVVIIQFHALGYIEKGVRRRQVNDANAYWKLTPMGERALYELRAIRRIAPGSEAG